jgi:hypothetical protein
MTDHDNEIDANASANANANGYTELIYKYCKDGELDQLNALLNAKNTDPNLEEKLNAQHPPHGWTPLMVAVANNRIEIVDYLLSQSRDALMSKSRRRIDIYKKSYAGGTAEDYAINEDIGNLLSGENERQDRLKNNATWEGFHETNRYAYEYINKDILENRYPMVGGHGGMFGGGIYFAFTPEGANHKSLNRMYGYKCDVRMGKIYKIDTKERYDEFLETYCKDSDTFNIPTDVMQKRLLENGYDSVHATTESIYYIKQTGGEFVVYSADQAKVKEAFQISYALNADKHLVIDWKSQTNPMTIPNYSRIYTRTEYKKYPLLFTALMDIGVLNYKGMPVESA